MKTASLKILAAAAAFGLMSAPAIAETTPPMIQTQSQPETVVDIAVGSDAHTTLVSAVTAAGLVETLQGEGPFTVFAPTNDAFAKIPAATLEAALLPENRAMLTKILTYHVVPGKVLSADLLSQIEAGGGSASLTTVQGGVLTAQVEGSSVVLTDETGAKATVQTADLEAGNGVVHVTDAVSMPK